MVSLVASFVLSFFPLDVLDEIWDLIESVSEGFFTYSYLSIYKIYRREVIFALVMHSEKSWRTYLSDVSTFLLSPPKILAELLESNTR